MMKLFNLLMPLLACPHVAHAFNYALLEVGGISLTDAETSISDIKTIFTDEVILVQATDVVWEPANANVTSGYTLTCVSSVDGVPKGSATFDLSTLEERELLDSFECGNVTVTDSGTAEISVTLTVEGDETEATTSTNFEAYGAGAAIAPLLVVLVLALGTQMVEFSLFFAVFVGACMVSGEIKDGFFRLLDDYILNAITDVGHVYVILFTLFLSGMVGMMEKSGGMIGFTQAIGKYATTARAGQFATFCIGIMVFFDDYANTLLAGQTMRPLTDLLFISREKLAFIVDATAAPIASISPISSWVGFEVSLIEAEIARIIDVYGEENVTIETSGLAVFFQSIKYRYYPIFMLILMPLLIIFKRDWGPMLIAERKTQVYERTDGGDGAGKEPEDTGGGEGGAEGGANDPRPDTPKKAYNMLLPILLLVFFIFYLLVKTGDDGSGDQSFMDKIEASDSYAALLWGTMAAANITTLFYMVQIVWHGELVLPTLPVISACFARRQTSETVALKESPEDADIKTGEEINAVDDEAIEVVPRPRSLMSLYDNVEAFLYGMGRIFPALIVLTLAWASGSVMVAVGADRLFSRWITGGVSAEWLPTLSFIISAFMALATGTSWGTMTILFPLICLPTYQVSNGDETIFYATVAGILSGSVAGDHVSPISDTTVLSALATDCNLLAHVTTQAPYAGAMALLAIVFGTIPIGQDAWPNIVGILLGALAVVLLVFGLGVPILSPTGRYDIITTLMLKCKSQGSPLYDLRDDTIKAYQKNFGDGVYEDEPVPEQQEKEVEMDVKDVPEVEPTSDEVEKLDPAELNVEVGSGTPEPSGTTKDELWEKDVSA